MSRTAPLSPPILMIARPTDKFLGNLLLFGRLLRSLGLDITSGQVADYARILPVIAVGRRDDWYYAARSIFVHRQSDLAVFDRVFELFFSVQHKPQQTIIDPTQSPARRVWRRPGMQQLMELQGRRRREQDRKDNETAQPDIQMAYSPIQLLRNKNFEQFSHEEIRTARRLIAEMQWNTGHRLTRRMRSAPHGAEIDFKRLLRSNIKHGAELIHLPGRTEKYKPRPLIVLADISGSMERYTRMVLHLLHTLSCERARVEVFTFGTRLTRITPDLRKRNVDAALGRVGQRVSDWSGGTRIGDALKTFNFKWARRVLRSGSVVMIISDGWDRGDLESLSREMARLQRSCFRLIWLNPLLGDRSFVPNAQGLQVALPYVDDFLPVHNLVSLEVLVELLGTLTDVRPLRKQQSRVSLFAPEPSSRRATMEPPQMGTSDYVRRTMTMRTIDGVPKLGYEENPEDDRSR